MNRMLSLRRTNGNLCSVGLLAGTLLLTVQVRAAEPTAEGMQFFESRVRPVLIDHCFKCHADKKQRGGLRLDSRGALLAGGDRGTVLVLGKPEESLLIQAILHEDELKMPPSKKLSREQIADLTQWVRMGAPWPGPSVTPASGKSIFQITAKDRAHWAFQS